MATWNMGQYDSIQNDARRMDNLEYTRQRQDVLDKRAAQDYALRHESDLRKAAREKAEFEQYMRTLPAQQKLTDWNTQKKINAMQQEQAEESYKNITPEQRSLLNILANGTATNIKFKGRDYGSASTLTQNQIRSFGLNPFWVQMHKNALETKKNKEKATELADLKHQAEVDKYKLNARINKEKNAALDDAKLKKDFLSRPLDPETEAYHKVIAGVPLSKAEKTRLEALHPLRYDIDNGDIDGENMPVLSIEDYIRREYKRDKNQDYFKGVNESYIPLIREQYTKNAPAIAKQKQQDQYNTVSGFMTGFYNDAVNSGSIDPKVAKSKDVVDAATRIFIASNGSLTPKQAFYQAAGIKQKNNVPPPPSGVSETENNQLYRLYGKAYQKLDDETKEKLAAVYSEWKEKYEPSADLTGDAYYQAAQRSAVAYQDLLKKYDLPTDFNTPIDEELYHLEYDNIHNELLAREKAISGKFPRWYSWAKNNPNVRIGSYTMAKNLINHSKDQMTAVEQSQRHSQEYKSFLDELNKIQQLRNDLVNRETWLKNLDANRRYGNK